MDGDVHAAVLQRWTGHGDRSAPWLHEEVATRMLQRLDWIRLQPRRWAHWRACLGGPQAHRALLARYPQAEAVLIEPLPAQAHRLAQHLRPQGWRGWLSAAPAVQRDLPPSADLDMVWANMWLHLDADPRTTLADWLASLRVGGFLMFSCLGPGTLQPLRDVYRRHGWDEPFAPFVDMHDWGDRLVSAGFAEPVVDVETIRLSFSTAAALLDELRGLGRNASTRRFPACRGRRWHATLAQALAEGLASPNEGGRLVVPFEIIYGHALRPQPRLNVAGETRVSLADFRRAIHHSRGPG